MKCSKTIMGALAVALGLFVSASYGESLKSDNFESYTLDSPIHGQGSWIAGEGDQSIVTTNAAVNDSKVLKVATDGTTLTNTLGSIDIVSQSVYMDADVLFVPSEELTQFNVEAPGNKALKLGLYSYKPEGAATAKLVIFHAVADGQGVYSTINDVTDVDIPTNGAVKVKVVMKKYNGKYDVAPPPTAFSVSINEVAVTTANGYADATLGKDYLAPDPTDPGEMFLIANITNGKEYTSTISALNITGTGYLDNFEVGVAGGEPPPPAGYVAGETITDKDGVSITLTEAQAAWLDGYLAGGDKAAMNETLKNGDGDLYGLEAEYLLNSSPIEATTVSFKIDSIVVGAAAKVNVTLTRTEKGTALDSALNGTIAILSADAVDGVYAEAGSLAKGLAAGEWADTVGAKKFFKAELK